MKKIFYILLIGSLLSVYACNNRDKEVSIVYPNGEPQKVEHVHYKGNQRIVDKVIYYYKDGVKESEYEYKNGKKHGKAVYYYPNGQKKTVEHYKNGKLNGRYIKYYRSGKYSYEASYKDNVPHGTWIYYDENGNKTSEQHFENGELID